MGKIDHSPLSLKGVTVYIFITLSLSFYPLPCLFLSLFHCISFFTSTSLALTLSLSLTHSLSLILWFIMSQLLVVRMSDQNALTPRPNIRLTQIYTPINLNGVHANLQTHTHTHRHTHTHTLVHVISRHEYFTTQRLVSHPSPLSHCGMAAN